MGAHLLEGALDAVLPCATALSELAGLLGSVKKVEMRTEAEIKERLEAGKRALKTLPGEATVPLTTGLQMALRQLEWVLGTEERDLSWCLTHERVEELGKHEAWPTA